LPRILSAPKAILQKMPQPLRWEISSSPSASWQPISVPTDGFEFSEDGVNFHAVRTLNDAYYRYADSESGLVFCIGPAAAVQGVTASQVKKTAAKQALIFA